MLINLHPFCKLRLISVRNYFCGLSNRSINSTDSCKGTIWLAVVRKYLLFLSYSVKSSKVWSYVLRFILQKGIFIRIRCKKYFESYILKSLLNDSLLDTIIKEMYLKMLSLLILFQLYPLPRETVSSQVKIPPDIVKTSKYLFKLVL